MPAELGKNDPPVGGWLFHNKLSIGLGMVGIFLVGVGIFIALGFTAAKNKPSVEILSSSPAGDQSILVYVAGAVEKPGIYKLPVNSRLNDALIAAGGLSSSANRNWLETTANLAQKVSDGNKVYVPFANSNVKTPASQRGEQMSNLDDDKTYSSENGKVNLNNATKAELESLPGIGEVFSQRIIDYRVTYGQFASVDDLLKVEGIGQKLVDKIKSEVEI